MAGLPVRARRVAETVVKRLRYLKQTASRRYVSPVRRQLDPNLYRHKYRRFRGLPVSGTHEDFLQEAVVNMPEPSSNNDVLAPWLEEIEQSVDLPASDDVSHTLLHVEIAELPAESPMATGFWIRNRRSGSNILEREPYDVDVIHLEWPHHLNIFHEVEPHHTDVIDEDEPHHVLNINEEEPYHLGTIVKADSHSIKFDDEDHLCGLQRQSHGSGTDHSFRASREDLDFGSTQSALIISPTPGSEILLPDDQSDKNATFSGLFAIPDHRKAEDLKRNSTSFHGLQADSDHNCQLMNALSSKRLKHRSSVPERAIGNVDRYALARSKSAGVEMDSVSSRAHVGSVKPEDHEHGLESLSHCNAVDRFYAATRIVSTISQLVLPRSSLGRTQATTTRDDAKVPTSQSSTWTSAHSSLSKSLSLKTIQALLDGLPFEGLLTTATLGDKAFYSSVETYSKTRQKLESQAEPRHRFKNGKMAESDQAKLMCQAYPEMCCNRCSRKFGGPDRKRELACHRNETHGVITGTFGLEDGGFSGAHST